MLVVIFSDYLSLKSALNKRGFENGFLRNIPLDGTIFVGRNFVVLRLKSRDLIKRKVVSPLIFFEERRRFQDRWCPGDLLQFL